MNSYTRGMRNGKTKTFPINDHSKTRVRVGKTKKDHASGAWKQRLDNRAARAAA